LEVSTVSLILSLCTKYALCGPFQVFLNDILMLFPLLAASRFFK
jgi:hypothetical protein